MIDISRLRATIEAAFADRSLLARAESGAAIATVLELLDSGELRVATPADEESEDPAARWQVHGWIQKAIVLYFPTHECEKVSVGPFEYFDKLPVKRDHDRAGVRVVPPATVRRGAFIERGAVLMPSYVNVGARVGGGTMVDTWATVGSCAQVGRDVHLSGGVGLGGVLEPPGTRPVIVEDGAFIGSRAVIVEGVMVMKEAVIGAGVVLTASTTIIDVSENTPRTLRGYVPRRSVVIPGAIPKRFPAGEYLVPCALIIGQRKASTDRKTSLNEALRDFSVSV
ncbi:MAG: 2,3,4,5-tetrahydropyridine-2,6-dicarboxylate N-succinyltransferase [Candidatus Schekmanbacteria bacterium]|nr:2,3,4,5-tetrahydropyridine-2,6-dicarboxylate N-succinyltransferase [Candidatus Schekmanbacteria bacterium]